MIWITGEFHRNHRVTLMKKNHWLPILPNEGSATLFGSIKGQRRQWKGSGLSQIPASYRSHQELWHHPSQGLRGTVLITERMGKAHLDPQVLAHLCWSTSVGETRFTCGTWDVDRCLLTPSPALAQMLPAIMSLRYSIIVSLINTFIYSIPTRKAQHPKYPRNHDYIKHL